jgi:hypothetical protein
MSQEQWISLGWQVAGWLAALALPPAFVFGLKWLQAQAALTATDKRSAMFKLLAELAITAVTAAEQTIVSNPDKKQAALKFIDAYLKDHNITLPVFEIEAAIESAVFRELNHSPAPAVTEPQERRNDGDLRRLSDLDPVGAPKP